MIRLDFEELIAQAGYQTIDEFFKKFVLPVMLVSMTGFFLSLFTIGFIDDIFFSRMRIDLGIYIYGLPLLILILGIASIFIYPYMIYERKQVDINENVHYFITYMGALSTLHISRKKLLKFAGEKTEYGEIAKIMDKIAYLADYWNLGIVKSCRMMSRLVPSRIIANFLDRISASFDFGERVDEFLRKEQSVVMEDYSLQYKEELKTLDTTQDIVISLTVAMAFAMTFAFLVPLITGYNMMLLIGFVTVGLIVIDSLSLVFIESFITHDKICSTLPIKDEEYKAMRKALVYAVPSSAILLIFLIYLNFLPFPISFAIGMLPLGYIGYLAGQQEAAILRRDDAFPAFIRSFGGSLSAKGGSLIGTLGPLGIHDFGVLNDGIERLHKRLFIGADKFKAWMHFAGETGSNLIEKFSSIFIEVVGLGGDAEIASQIISDNFIHLLSLRQLRLQMASGMRGVYYGTLIGIAGATYVTLELVGILHETFQLTYSAVGSPLMRSMMEGIIPPMVDFNLQTMQIILFLIIVVHAGFSAFALKLIDGGNKFNALLDFTIMVWLIALVAISLPVVFNILFGGIGGGVSVPTPGV